jgi:cytochrome c-type biogenesis protein CcmE
MSQASSKRGVPWLWVISALFIAFLIVAFGMKAIEGMVSYYVTVEEAMGDSEGYEGKRLKLAGYVTDENFQVNGQRYEFTVAYGDHKVPVVYEGFAPDTFAVGVDVIVEGRLSDESGQWIFTADSLMAKCASKYEIGELPQQNWQSE